MWSRAGAFVAANSALYSCCDEVRAKRLARRSMAALWNVLPTYAGECGVLSAFAKPAFLCAYVPR